MTVKIQFKYNTWEFEDDKSYVFHNKSGNLISMKFMGLSRIDGYPMFHLTNPPVNDAIVNYFYNEFEIKEVHLVGALEDHLVGFMAVDVESKKREILRVVMQELGITDRDLLEEGSEDRIIRNIRLNKLLNGDGSTENN